MSPPPLPASYDALPWTQIRTQHHAPDPRIVILTLHRPDKHNAFTDTMMAEMVAAYELFDRDERVRCIVVTGTGRIFCAGADLEIGFRGGGDGDGGREKEKVGEHRDGGGRVVLAIQRCRKPTIAALNGSAVGIGITMTLPMSIRIAPRAAKIGFVFARRGLVMEACSSYLLPRLIGYSRAMAAVTTGATYRADDAIWDGLFTHVVDDAGQVLGKALEVAGDVVRNTSAVSTYLMKEMMWRGRGSAEGQHLLDSRVLFDLFASADNKEGVESFMQKRPAQFTGTMENTTVSAYPWWNPIDVAPPSKADGAKAKL